MRPEVRICETLDSLSRAVAAEVVRLSLAAVSTTSRFTVALAGGRTPRPLYQLLAGEFREHIPWSRMLLFWTDERYVPPAHPASNYRIVREVLLDEGLLPAENVHPMPTSFSDPHEAARVYETTLRKYFPGRWPEFDLVLLGVGLDGHIASLFPGSPALNERRRWVVAVNAPAEPPWRLSLTLPALRHARRTFVLVSGSGKDTVVGALLRDPTGHRRYPAALVRPGRGVVWFLDGATLGPLEPIE